MDYFRRHAPVLIQVVVLVVIIAVIIGGRPSVEQPEEVISGNTRQVAVINDNSALPADTPQSNPADETGNETGVNSEVEPGENRIPPAGSTAEPAVKREADAAVEQREEPAVNREPDPAPDPKVKVPENSNNEPTINPVLEPTADPVSQSDGDLAGVTTEIPADNQAAMTPENEDAAPAEAGNRETTAGSEVSRGNSTARVIVNNSLRYLGAPYRYGGTTPSGFDCSGFVRYVFGLEDIELPRSSREQATVGTHVDKGSLLPADLVFFKTDGSSRINHVGIYLGDNNFVHASRTRGIVITSLDDKYYLKAYYGARRVIK
jgi:cell wall-associated NlpC family hydrolase